MLSSGRTTAATRAEEAMLPRRDRPVTASRGPVAPSMQPRPTGSWTVSPLFGDQAAQRPDANAQGAGGQGRTTAAVPGATLTPVSSLSRSPVRRVRPAAVATHRDTRGRGAVAQLVMDPTAVPDSSSPPSGSSRLERERWAVSRWRGHLEAGTGQALLDALANKSRAPADLRVEATRVFGELPVLSPRTTWTELAAWGVWPDPPCADVEGMLANLPRYAPGREVLVCTPVVSTWSAGDVFLTVRAERASGSSRPPSGDDPPVRTLITHRARVAAAQRLEADTCAVEVDAESGGTTVLQVPWPALFALNEPTRWRSVRVSSGTSPVLQFDDGIRCRFHDAMTRAKLIQAALAVSLQLREMPMVAAVRGERRAILGTMHRQLACIQAIADSIDLEHIGSEGQQPGRYFGLDVGRLAHHGQFHCHGEASVVAAFLLCFGRSLGWEVRYRQGSRYPGELGRGGTPRQADEHAWIEVTLLPSGTNFVSDLTFGIAWEPFQSAYHVAGGRYPRHGLDSALPARAPVRALPDECAR